MQWLSQNWVFLLVAVAFVAMHLFGHGHGGHGGHAGHGRDEDDRGGLPARTDGHRH